MDQLDTSLPLYEYLFRAAKENEYWMGVHKHDDLWLSPLFNFVRAAKAHPALTNLSAHKALTIVEFWLTKASDDLNQGWNLIAGKELEIDDAEAEFIAVWNAIRFLPGQTLLDVVLAMAAKNPLKFENERNPGYQSFISFAGWLQAFRPKQAILLPVHKIDKVLGVSYQTIKRYRDFAVEDGFLAITEQHTYRKGGGGEATEFRFKIERFPELVRFMAQKK